MEDLAIIHKLFEYGLGYALMGIGLLALWNERKRLLTREDTTLKTILDSLLRIELRQPPPHQ